MRDLRAGGNTTVTACDVDAIVLTHPCSHTQVVIKPDEPLPFTDETFDVIANDTTFEHIENPELVSRELLRTLRPAGYICARTPNRFGYLRPASGLFPNRLHIWLLGYFQPDRKAEDVFPTRYKLNSGAQIKRWFSGCDVYHYFDSAEPAYYFGRKAFYHIFFLIHKLVPASLATGICFFIKKPSQ
ncbi:MAG: methyltransferase domain-containing protein [Candidatus Acidiferrales bacterium]